MLLDEVTNAESEEANCGDNGKHSADSTMSRTTFLARLNLTLKPLQQKDAVAPIVI